VRLGRQAGGFTLLEVLIAVLVLSVGLLGLAGLQAHSLRTNNAALMRSQAIVVAYDALDMMRANRDQALRAGDSGYAVAFGDDVSPVDCAPCSSGQQARNDVATWRARIQALGLPSGEGEIVLTGSALAGSGVKASVRVRWDDDRDGSNTGEREQILVESLL
jgi:type IV pilus assembly protein PilV